MKIKIVKEVDVPAEDLTTEELETLTCVQLIEVIKDLQCKVKHAHDYTNFKEKKIFKMKTMTAD